MRNGRRTKFADAETLTPVMRDVFGTAQDD
jgi:hypothetical protein